jgi:DNA-binding IclR family transcriptional regulator
LDRQVGDFPIKTLTLNIGDRRPLGVGAGSLMLLAALPDAQVSAAIAANAGKLEAYSRYSPEILRKLVQRTRADGYAYNDGRVLRAMNAIAVPVMDAEGTVIAALSVASIAQRMTKKRISMIVKLLEHEAAQLRHVPVSVRQQGESV